MSLKKQTVGQINFQEVKTYVKNGAQAQRKNQANPQVVKMTNRLIKKGTLVISGPAHKGSKPGKKELLYALSVESPLAIGIDVEYGRTHLILTNLNGDLLAEAEHPTPQNPTVPSLRTFLLYCLEDFFSKLQSRKNNIAGIGIGLPGVVIPAWLKPDIQDNRKNFQDFLSSKIGIPVIIEINPRASTNYLKWNNPFFPGKDFMFVAIRTGVGMVIIFRDELFIAHQFISGELGHMKIAGGKVPCRCGGTGCLETMVNQDALYREYRTKVVKEDDGPAPSKEDLTAGLQDLFSKAADGVPEARRVVKKAGTAIGKALSYTLMSIFIPQVILSGHFGPRGDIIIPSIQAEFAKNLLPSMHVDIRYLPIEKVKYAHGAALLAIKEYLGNNLRTTLPGWDTAGKRVFVPKNHTPASS